MGDGTTRQLQVLADTAAWFGDAFTPDELATLAAPDSAVVDVPDYTYRHLRRRLDQVIYHPSLDRSSQAQVEQHARAAAAEPTVAGLILRAMFHLQPHRELAWATSTHGRGQSPHDVMVYDGADRPIATIDGDDPDGPPAPPPHLVERRIPPRTPQPHPLGRWRWEHSPHLVRRRTWPGVLAAIVLTAAVAEVGVVSSAVDFGNRMVGTSLGNRPVEAADADALRVALENSQEQMSELAVRLAIEPDTSPDARNAVALCLHQLGDAIDATERRPPTGSNIYAAADDAYETCDQALVLATAFTGPS